MQVSDKWKCEVIDMLVTGVKAGDAGAERRGGGGAAGD